jgi:hypothetical protein
MKSLPFLVLALSFLVSCKAPKPTPTLDQTITIDLTKSVESQGPAEGWIENIQFIPLETKPDGYISSRLRYNLNQDHIVVTSNETVHLFNRNGNHLKSFKRVGKGPGEYGMVYLIDLVPDRDEIMVAAPNQRKILCYDFNGNSTCEIITPFMAADVAPIAGGLFACHLGRMVRPGENGPELYQTVFINREGKVVSKYLPFKYPMRSVTSVDFSYSGEKGIYFINPAYGYDIYQAGPGNQFSVKYRFSYGNYSLDTSLLSNEKVMTSTVPDRSFGDKFTDLDHLAITSNTISLWGPLIQAKPRMGSRMINRSSGHVRFMELDSLFNYGHYAGFPIEFTEKSSGEFFTFTKDAVDLIEIYKKLTPDQRKTLSKFKGFDRLSKLKEDDNPVLVLFKVKDF